MLCLLIGGAATHALAADGAPQSSANPDELYAARENLASAKRAADLWAAHADTDYESAWKLARVCYWIGTEGSKPDRRDALARGLKAGQSAIALGPDRPEGHFWLAANMGATAEAGGMMQGLKYRGAIKRELERTIAIQPDWQEGSAECALGRWYFEVPGWGFGGSHSKAKDLLRGVLAKHPDSLTALSFLADVLIDEGKDAEARPLLQRVLDAPIDPEWAPDDENFKKIAREKMATLK